MSQPANVFIAYLAQKLAKGGTETIVYLDRMTTLTGEEIVTGDFATFARGVLTVNPDADGDSEFPEYISFTGVADNTLTGAIRGLSAKSDSVIAANKRFHPTGTPVVLSFGSHNIQDLINYTDTQIAALTLGSSLVEIGTAGEILSKNDLVYLKSDGKWWKTDASADATISGVQVGIAQGIAAADGAITGGVLHKGLATGLSGLVTGTEYFASDTAGGIDTSTGTVSRKIGVAQSTTTLLFDPLYGQNPTGDEKAGMAGINNTPTVDNPFATKDDLSDPTVLPPKVVVFTADGTWTKDDGLKYILVEVQAGGAPGGQGGSSSNGYSGGAGGYSRKLIPADDLAATEAVTVGAISAASSFGAHATTTAASGQTGGTAASGDINIPGQNGHDGLSNSGSGSSSEYRPPAETPSMFGAAGYGSGGRGESTNSGDEGPGVQGVVIVTEYYS